MITKFEKYNESIRDTNGVGLLRSKMTPKSDEDIRLAFVNLVNSLEVSSPDKFPNEFQLEFEKISDLFGVPKDSLYLISEEGDQDYSTFEDFFEEIIDSNNKVIIDGVKNEYGESTGEWTCYPDQKVARWSANDFDSQHAWIFPKNLFKDKLYESIRDMMTPKSREEIIKNLKGRKDIIFERSNNPLFTKTSGEIGRMPASYDDLVELFGEPDDSPDGYKISTEWCLVDSLGRYCSLFDWKETNLYDEDYPTVEEFRSLPTYDWIISGDINEKDIMEDLKTYIMLNIT